MLPQIRQLLTERLGDQPIPYDLEQLLHAYEAAQKPKGFFAQLKATVSGTNRRVNPLRHINATLLWPGQTYPLLDHSYLNDVDHANAETMANVAAMRDTAENLKFILQIRDTSLLGYWQPDPSVPLADCPLFWLDTEGQYYIAEGETLAETLAYRAITDDKTGDYQTLLVAYRGLGVTIKTSEKEAIFDAMDARKKTVLPTPQQYRFQRYEHHLAAGN